MGRSPWSCAPFPNPGQRSGAPLRGGLSASRARARSSGTRVVSSAPVSYTHLRAHETSAHL
eukprot:15019319-Alexandrium_andersonii.AAC.1